jgi:hypothetical protein
MARMTRFGGREPDAERHADRGSPRSRRRPVAVVAERALFFVGAALGFVFLGSTFGWPVLALVAGIATAVRVAAETRSAGRARALRTVATAALVALHAAWTYLAVVFGWLLAWTVPSAVAVAIAAVAVVALVGWRRPIAGVRVPLALPLGAWIALCLLGWMREDGVIRCADYLRFRSDASLQLVVPSTRALVGCAAGDTLRLERYPRRVWEAPDGSRYVVVTQRGVDPTLGTPVPDPIDGSICEFAPDGTRRHCVGEYKTQAIFDSEPLDRIFIGGWEGHKGILYAVPRSDALRILQEVRTEAGTGEGYYDPAADEIALLADECSGLVRFRASDLSPLPTLPAPFCPGEAHYDAERHEGIFCFAPVGPLGPLLLGTGDYLSVAFRGTPFAPRLLGAPHVLRYGAMVWGCDFDPVRRVAWIAIANLGVIAVTDYDTGEVLDTWWAEPGLRSAAFDARRRRLYVTNFLRGDVVAYDVETGREVGRWFVGRFARWVGSTRDRTALLATSNLGVVRIPLAAPDSEPQLP